VATATVIGATAVVEAIIMVGAEAIIIAGEHRRHWR